MYSISEWKHGKLHSWPQSEFVVIFFPLTKVQRLFQMCYLVYSCFRESFCFVTACASFFFFFFCEFFKVCKICWKTKLRVRFYCVPDRHAKTWNSGDNSLPVTASKMHISFHWLTPELIRHSFRCALFIFFCNFHIRNGVHVITHMLPADSQIPGKFQNGSIKPYSAHVGIASAFSCLQKPSCPGEFGISDIANPQISENIVCAYQQP